MVGDGIGFQGFIPTVNVFNYNGAQFVPCRSVGNVPQSLSASKLFHCYLNIQSLISRRVMEVGDKEGSKICLMSTSKIRDEKRLFW